MKKKRFSIEQIVTILKQPELGMPVDDLIDPAARLSLDLALVRAHLEVFENVDNGGIV